jgi:PHD/YefM family antitoxin component YafN of YafNO toxin-antitoxin module
VFTVPSVVETLKGAIQICSIFDVLTAFQKSDTVTPMARISIKELHAKTGEEVRKAGKSRTPVGVTDHGKLVAVLASPHLYRPTSRRRVLLREYAALLTKAGADDVLEDLDAVRGDR